MKAIVQHQYGSQENPELQERLARVSGLLYLVLAVFGMFSAIVLETLVVPGDAATTAANILGARWLFGGSLVGWIVIVVADVAVSVTLYLLLEPVSRALSLVAAAFRLVYAAILGAVLLNLYDAFLLLTAAGRGWASTHGSGRPWPCRPSTPSAPASCSPSCSSASTWWRLASCSTDRATCRGRSASWSLPRAPATSEKVSRPSSCPATAAWRARCWSHPP
jgi:hypothetical protein